ncbi:MAG: DUF3817 domain-containing protein [Flavobacteriales bacterium]|nr:DUF3817 domain-containing protein [Flavobacteriales bacterium]
MGYLEGISFLILLAVCVPLKHVYGILEPTKIVGMAHGILFVLYGIFLIEVRSDHQWDTKTTILSFIAAFLPFGTFIADNKIFKAYIGK